MFWSPNRSVPCELFSCTSSSAGDTATELDTAPKGYIESSFLHLDGIQVPLSVSVSPKGDTEKKMTIHI